MLTFVSEKEKAKERCIWVSLAEFNDFNFH